MTLPDPYIEADLLNRIRHGDKSACDECITLHYDALHRLAMRLVADPMEAEDIVQESFLRAFKAIHTFDGRSRLSTWLFRITYNTAMMMLRKKTPPSVSVDEPVDSNGDEFTPIQLFDWCCLPEDDLLRSEALTEVGRAIEELPATLREVFIMREFEGISTIGVAETLNLSESAVKVRLHRARLALRSKLGSYFGEVPA